MPPGRRARGDASGAGEAGGLSVRDTQGKAMSSWVRYSVAVYAGLLFAGSMLIPKPEASALSEWVPFAARKQEQMTSPRWDDVQSPRRVATTPSATHEQPRRLGEPAVGHDLFKTLEPSTPGEPGESPAESAKHDNAAADDDTPRCDR